MGRALGSGKVEVVGRRKEGETDGLPFDLYHVPRHSCGHAAMQLLHSCSDEERCKPRVKVKVIQPKRGADVRR